MILNTVKPNIETSGELDQKFFSIEDQGMLFEILRSKLYSNPILAICREYSCNALDAHREAGKPELPIEIHLPNFLEPEYRIKDFGVGISPDRMENVFIKYAASTKRNDNIQIGAMGLGAKSAFSTTDSFVIITIHNFRKYHYTCFIDETRVGKLALLSQTETDESNGTEIVIPVKPSDFTLFKQYTEQVCRHWQVKPKIVNGEISYRTMKKAVEGKNWAITDFASDGAKLIIDCIEYPLDLMAVEKYANIKLINAIRGTLVMYFDTGELSLAANREQIYLDQPTQDKIKIRLNEIKNDIVKQVQNKINSLPNLWEANVYYGQELGHVFRDLEFLGKLSWQVVELNSSVEIKCHSISFKKNKFSRKHPETIKRCDNRRLIFFDKKSVLYLNDLGLMDLTSKHVKPAFDNDPNLESVQIICPDDRQSEVDLNRDIRLDLMQPLKLSSIATPGKVSKPPSERLIVFKFDTSIPGFRQVSYETMKQDARDKVFCMLRTPSFSSPERMVLLNRAVLGNAIMKSIVAKFQQVSFYGVNENISEARIKKEFHQFVSLDKFINSRLLDDQTNYLAIKIAMHHTVSLSKHDEVAPKIKNPNSLFLKRLHAYQELKKLQACQNHLLDTYEIVKGRITGEDLNNFLKVHPEWDIENLTQQFNQKYPLIQYISEYHCNSAMIAHMALYINMIDQGDIK